jgi:hypothetical protein
MESVKQRVQNGPRIVDFVLDGIAHFAFWLYSIYNVKWTYDKVSKPPTQISMNISLSVYTQKKI